MNVKQKVGLSKCILDICLHLHRHTNPTLIRIKTAGSGRCYTYAYQNETRIIRGEESWWNESLPSRGCADREKARYPHRYLDFEAPHPIAPGVIQSNRQSSSGTMTAGERTRAYVGKCVPRRLSQRRINTGSISGTRTDRVVRDADGRRKCI
ncbi:Uncharacterized protein DBV15_00683 [Temnothorax longispinosus]|uniref:Uncharacterized protein n=1 Tax=Temnothorax longispinosus TaxID=300112 RepID=A0A4S2KN58_9HYME|nr:Uncharacterized protein DBV15_00683 [Temnothorax longispinosus]